MTQQVLSRLEETVACIETLKTLCSKKPSRLYWLHLQIVTSGLACRSRIALETAEDLLSIYNEKYGCATTLQKQYLLKRMKGDVK